MIFPASTRSPPNFFTPRRCALESRPLRVEPPPFLCAISLPSAQNDFADANFRLALPMTELASIVLPALVLEDDDLLASPVLHDLGGHHRAADEGGAHPVVAVVR